MNEKVDEEQLAHATRYDDLLQAAISAVGGQFQAQQLGMNGKPATLTGQAYNSLTKIYENDGLFSSAIDRAAEDAMAAGFEFHEKANPKVIDEFDRLELDEVFTDALRFARLHGGAIILPIYEGNAQLSSPVSRNRTWRISYFEVISIDRLSVDTRGTDGMPEVYNVESLVNHDGGQFKLHASRCIYVAGRRRPYKQIDTELIWPGVSEGQRVMKEVLSLSRSFQWAEKALERKSQAIFKMKGLAAALQNKMQDLVTQRLNMTDAVRSLLNTVAIDSDDEFDVSDTNLASISDTLDSKMQAFSGVTGYPITVFFGRRTTSLNAKGDSDTDTYYRMLNKLRRNMLRNPLSRVVELIGNYIDVGIPEGEVLVKIAKLDSLTEFEEAEIEVKRATALKARAEAVKILTATGEAPQTTAKPPAEGKPAPAPVATPSQALITSDEARALLFPEEFTNE